jgi:fatty acid desaturase
MEEDVASAPRLSREEMKRLLARRDAPGLKLFSVQLAAFVLLSIATVQLAAAGSWLRWPVVFADGLVLLMFFASMHEAGHGTAFATPWMNRAVTWISAFLMLQSPTFFREFHFEHHRRTSDPHGDPEISGAPGLLGVWPANPLFYFILASGQHLMFGKAAFTIGCAAAPGVMFEKYYPFMKPALRPAIVRESWIVVAVWAFALWLGLTFVAGFGTLLLAWPIAHLGLGLFVMPEHTGLGSDGSQIHRTRSTTSNALVRTAMWNMPYHAEHHEYPAVPFHAAPELSRRIDADLENRSRGYLAFHAEALLRSFGSGRA